MMSLRVLAFSGSLREKSLNRKLLSNTVEGARSAGAEVEVLDLRDLDMPIYNGDLEEAEGLPPVVLEFTKRVRASDGILIASPEHNASVPSVLKNTIDWASRDRDGQERGFCFDGKLVALIAASPGKHGATRGLSHLRQILGNIGATVIEPQFGLPGAHEAFDEASQLIEPGHDAQARQIGIELVHALEEAQTST
jgi:NAD(P)H-dependent FMN reductase